MSLKRIYSHSGWGKIWQINTQKKDIIWNYLGIIFLPLGHQVTMVARPDSLFARHDIFGFVVRIR